MKLSRDIANKIFDILVLIGATPLDREYFIKAHMNNDCQEWRFQGKLGFGGKFWNEWTYNEEKYKWKVSCYSEDETPERLQIINNTNTKLCELSETKNLGKK